MSEVISNKKSWENLYISSQRLTQANSSDDMFSDDDIVSLSNLVKKVIVKFLENGVLHQGIKVYVNRKLDNEAVQKMAERKPREEETIEEWCNEIFGEDKFGVIFNSLERYDNEFAEKMCSIVSPLLKKAGLPLGGLSFLFFMGNYGFTPFGIHKEAKGEEGFLFHLGPADKKFYTWDIEEYNKIEHNAKVFHEVDEMLPASKCYDLKPKSVMFIPHHLYHIGNTEEFSLSVVMDYINPSRAHLENTIAKEIATQKGKSVKSNDYINPIANNGSGVNMENLLDSSSWESRYRSSLERMIKRLRSNSGVLKPAIIDNSKFFPGDKIKIKGKQVFPLIEFIDDNNDFYIMARGHEIRLKPHPNLSNIINKLNRQEWVDINELNEELQPDWDMVDVFGFVNYLWSISAIEIEE